VKLEELLGRISEFTSDGIIITEAEPLKDPGPKILWCNNAVLETSGYTQEDLIGKSPRIFQGIDTDKDTIRRISQKLRMWQPVREHLLNYRKDGTPFWIDLNLWPVADDTGWFRYWVGIQREVSLFIKMQEDLLKTKKMAETSQKRLWAAIEALPEAFVMYDAEDRLITCNSKYKEIYAASSAAIFEGAYFEDVIRCGLANGQYPQAAGKEEVWLEERLELHKNPRGPIYETLPGDRFLQIHEVHTKDGDTVGFRSDVTELRRQKFALEEQTKALGKAKKDAVVTSLTDALTGLGNRRGLDWLLADLAQKIVPGFEVALVHVDLDRFKAINDVFGHAAGDHVLCMVAQILRDSVTWQEYIARVGGDEFVIAAICRDAQSRGEAIAEHIIKACQKSFDFNGKELRVGASIGIAVASKPGVSDLMENADIALYEAKTAGRNRYALFTPKLRALAEEKKYMADELLKAFANNQIFPYFQPQVAADDRTFIGVEALARWQHPSMGFVPPEVFLCIAEELGMLSDIDDIILKKSLAMVQRLKAQRIQIPKLSVNVSYRRLKRDGLLDKLAELRPWPCQLAFELLETIDYDQEADSFGWILEGLRELGIEIELDDFGSGRASITTLLRLRPDRIKIDRQLVAAVASEVPGANPLVKAIGQMGKALNIQLTAEGIETEIQAKVLKRLGCNVFQGHLFSQPLCENDLVSWVSQHKSRQETVLRGRRNSGS